MTIIEDNQVSIRLSVPPISNLMWLLITLSPFSAFSCDPGLLLRPAGGERIESQLWRVETDSLQIDTHPLGGLIIQNMIEGRFGIRNRRDADITVTGVSLRTRAGTYDAGRFEDGVDGPLRFYRVQIPRGDRRTLGVVWRFPADSTVFQTFVLPCTLLIAFEELGTRRVTQIPYTLLTDKDRE